MPNFLCTESYRQVIRAFKQVTIEADTAEQARALLAERMEEEPLWWDDDDTRILDTDEDEIDIREID